MTELERVFKPIKRRGLKNLIRWMEENGIYTAPASTRWHGACDGGLMDHCEAVQAQYTFFYMDYKFDIKSSSVVLVSWLHDICKLGLYMKTEDGYTYNTSHPKGHGQLSVDIAKQFISLKPVEEKIIKYHMSYYHSTDLSPQTGEYDLEELKNAQNDPAVLLFYFADHLATVGGV